MTQTLDDRDRIAITWILEEGGMDPADVRTAASILREGVRRGESDSIEAVAGFRRAAEARGGSLADLVRSTRKEAAALRASAQRMHEEVDRLRMIASLTASDDAAARIVLRALDL